LFPLPLSRTPRSLQFLYGLALPVSLGIWLLPLIAIALTSLRSVDDLNRGNYWGRPSELHFVENYGAIFTNSPMGIFVLNSFTIAIPAVAGTVLLSAMAGFALAKYRFPGNMILLATFIAGNFVPFQMLMIPVRSLVVDVLGIYNTRWAVVLFHIAFQTGFATLFMRGFIRSVPDSLIEAARLEGVGELAIFWKIVLPLVKPAMAGLSVLVFTFVWNDFFWSLVLVHSDSVRPITAGLQSLKAMWLTSWHLIAAGSIVAAIPPVALFFLMQRQFITGLTAGIANE
jgi:multiple sugar transport system permease protein